MHKTSIAEIWVGFFKEKYSRKLHYLDVKHFDWLKYKALSIDYRAKTNSSKDKSKNIF